MNETERKFYVNLAEEKKQSYLLQVQKQTQEQEQQKVEQVAQKKAEPSSAKKVKPQRKESPERVQTAPVLKNGKAGKGVSQLSQSTNTSSIKGKGK